MPGGQEVASLFVTVGADTGGFERGMRNVQGTAQGVGSTLRNLALAAGAALGGAQIVNAALGFDRSMANIRAVTGRTAEEMAALQGEILKIGSASTVGPQAVADAFYDIAGGVADASSHMAILDAAIATSEAGQADLTATTGGLIAVMNAYGYEADKAMTVSDIFTRTVGVGVGTMEEFVGAMSPIAGTMATAGVGFQDLGTMMAYMTTKGVGANMAATQLRQATIALLNPNERMRSVLRRVGIESGAAAIKQFGLAGVLGQVQNAVGGSVDEMSKMMGSVEALNAALIINQPGFEDFIGTFEGGLAGATEAARALQLESAAAQFDKLKSNIEGLALTVGTSLLPIVNDVVTFGVDVLNAIVTKGPEIIAGIVAWFNSTEIGQSITTAWSNIQPAIQGLADNISSAFSALFQPGGGGATFNGPRELFEQTMAGINNMPAGAGQDLARKLAPNVEAGTRFQWFFDDIKTAILEGVPNVLNTLTSEISGIGTSVIDSLNTFVDGLEIPQEIKDVIDTVLTPLRDAFQKLGKIDWNNMLLAGGAILGVAAGIGGLGLALNLVQKIAVFTAIINGLEALSRVIDDLQTGDFKTVLTDLGDAFIAFGAALVVANLPALLGGISTAIGSGGALVGVGAGAAVGGTGLLLKLGLLGVAIGGLFTLMDQPWVQEGLGAWQGVFDNLTIIIQHASDEITRILNETAASIATFMSNSIFTTGAPMVGVNTEPMPPTYSGVNTTLNPPTGVGMVTGSLHPRPLPATYTPAGSLAPNSLDIFRSQGLFTAPATPGFSMFDHNVFGGPVMRGRATWVGERGPELFVPPTGGRIVPNNQLGGGGGGAVVIPVTLTLDGKVLFETVVREDKRRNGRGW